MGQTPNFVKIFETMDFEKLFSREKMRKKRFLEVFLEKTMKFIDFIIKKPMKSLFIIKSFDFPEEKYRDFIIFFMVNLR